MIKPFKPLIYVCAFLILVFSSCKKEGVMEVQNTNNISQNELKSLVSQVKVWHDSTVSSNLSRKIQNGVKAFSVNENDIVPPVVDWDKAFINFDSSSVKSVTVPISMNYKTGEHMQLVATKSKNKLNGYFIKVTPDSAYFANQIDIYNYTDFSGSIAIYNLMGVRLKNKDFKAGIVSNSKSSSKTSLGVPGLGGTTAEGLEVLVYTTIKHLNNINNRYTYGNIFISYNQDFGLDDFGGGGDVFAGGPVFDYFLSTVPNGQCAFGALSHLGALLGGKKDPNDYVKQWANKKEISFEKMFFNLLEGKDLPDLKSSVQLLEDNFNSYDLGNKENMLRFAKNGTMPVFVLINWPIRLGGGGHIGVVQWDSKREKLMFYDPVLVTTFPYEDGTDEFKYSTYFYGVISPK